MAIKIAVGALLALVLSALAASADWYGYRSYPSYYGPAGHTYRGIDYGRGLPYRGGRYGGNYGGYAAPRYVAPRSYHWYGGPPNAYLGGRGGGWGGEW